MFSVFLDVIGWNCRAGHDWRPEVNEPVFQVNGETVYLYRAAHCARCGKRHTAVTYPSA